MVKDCPFRVFFVSEAAGGPAWYASDETGIILDPRRSKSEAEADANVCNRIYQLGKRHGMEEIEAQGNDTPPDAFVAAMESVLDQKRPDVLKFVEMNPPEELSKVIGRYAQQSRGEDVRQTLDSLLAAYGLMTAILENAKQKRDEGR